MNLKNFIKSSTTLQKSSEIIFYGGSFNPWHDGHKGCVNMSPQDIPLIVMPDHNPQKEIVIPSSLDDALLKLNKEIEFRKHNAFIFDGFIQQDKVNPTHAWVEEFKSDFVDIHCSLLMGQDSFLTIHNWIDSHELLNNLKSLYIVSRLDDEIDKQEQKLNLLKIAPKLQIKFLGHHNHEALSSTILRKKTPKE